MTTEKSYIEDTNIPLAKLQHLVVSSVQKQLKSVIKRKDYVNMPLFQLL